MILFEILTEKIKFQFFMPNLLCLRALTCANRSMSSVLHIDLASMSLVFLEISMILSTEIDQSILFRK